MNITLPEIAHARLSNQHVATTLFGKPKDLVSWMGAMQAQDFNMMKWAVGIRLPGATVADIDGALDKGDLVRTHVLRPTWHLVASDDIRWMLELTAPHIHATARARLKELELTPSVLAKSLRVMENALAKSGHLTREELLGVLEKNKIRTDNQRAPYLLIHAELERIICSGKLSGKKRTYALFDERVKTARPLSREQALTRLANKYFQSHGPATLQDFTWWSGLPVADARRAVALTEKSLVKETIGEQTYWFRDLPRQSVGNTTHLLPAFDEYVISYKDRSACLPAKNQRTIISVNGIFWPIVVHNGQIVGQWKRVVTGKKPRIEIRFFPKSKVTDKHVVDAAKQKVIDFYAQEVPNKHA